MALEKSRLKLGIVPLVDCAPLVVAKERGFFAEQGLEVEISRQASWASIRDKVAVGALDGAHMLATMPLSMSLGLSAIHETMVVPMALNLGGNTITVSSALAERMRGHGGLTNLALKRVIEEDQAMGQPPMTFAMVYPFATHHYELRYWMAAAGINPDQDVRLVVVPPPQMVAHLSAGKVAGFCVGEPWGTLAASMGLAEVVARSNDIFGGRIEKVLGITARFAEEHPQTVQAMVRALTLAARWCDGNRAEVAEILSQPSCLNVPQDIVRKALEAPDAPVFHAHAANFPWRSQAIWYLTQMQRWGHVSKGQDVTQLAARTYRPALYRQAVEPLGIPCPSIDYKTEGQHTTPWQLTLASSLIEMAADSLLDGAVFDPSAPNDCFSVSIHKEISQ